MTAPPTSPWSSSVAAEAVRPSFRRDIHHRRKWDWLSRMPLSEVERHCGPECSWQAGETGQCVRRVVDVCPVVLIGEVVDPEKCLPALAPGRVAQIVQPDGGVVDRIRGDFPLRIRREIRIGGTL